MTDADTLRNADDLWKLVHLVQDTIDKDGCLLLVDDSGSIMPTLAEIRKLADECDPDYGKF